MQSKLALTFLLLITALGCNQEAATLPRTVDASAMSEIYVEGVPLKQAREAGTFRADEFAAAAGKFPTVQACLVAGAAKTSQLQIDWRKVGSEVEAAVCISRVATRLGSADAMLHWLRAHGFTIVGVGIADLRYEAPTSPLLGDYRVEARWSVKENGPMFRHGLLRSLRQRVLGRYVSVKLFFDKETKAISVNCTTIIL